MVVMELLLPGYMDGKTGEVRLKHATPLGWFEPASSLKA